MPPRAGCTRLIRVSKVSVSPANVPYFGAWSRVRSSALPSARIVTVSSMPLPLFWPRNVPIAQPATFWSWPGPSDDP
jgi:hypothetical protein